MQERQAWKIAAATLALGLLSWTLTLVFLPSRDFTPIEALVLVVTAILAEARSLYVPGYGAVNFGEGLYFAAALAWGGPVAAPIALLAGWMGDRIQAKARVIQVFNWGWSLTTFSLVSLCLRDFQPSQGLAPNNCLALGAGIATYAVTSGLLQSIFQSVARAESLAQTWKLQLRLLWMGAPATLSIGLFALSLLQLAPWAVVLSLFPVEMFSAYVRIRELHQQLLSAQSQLQANSRQAALGVLTAGVAHEINNPLAAMGTSLHLLERQPLDERGKVCLKLLSQGLERCQSITARMLLYSRPPENRPSSCKLDEVVRDAQLFLSTRLGGVTLNCSPALAEAPALACDPGLLVQVLTNLIGNAADVARNLHIELHDRQLWVRDDGPGIPAEQRERIWEPFFTTKPIGQGTGLGLPISQSLMRNAGGDLSLKHSGPEGSIFVIQLPPWVGAD